MGAKEIITIVGWLVTCLLSVLAGGWIIPQLTKKRKILVWATVAESELIPLELYDKLSLPVSIQVGGVTPKSLSLITIRLGNAGNEVMEQVSPAIRYNSGASALYVKPRGDLGEYHKCIVGHIEKEKVQITFSHINPGYNYEFEILICDYELGSISVDLSAPGVDLIRRDSSKWELTSSALQICLSFFGIRYAPESAFLAAIAAELKAIRIMMLKRK
jgi:hypothetical protein